MPLQIDSRLLELDFGQGEGLTDQEQRERFPDARAAFVQDPAANFLPGGEDPVHAARRGTEALHHIASRPQRGKASPLPTLPDATPQPQPSTP